MYRSFNLDSPISSANNHMSRGRLCIERFSLWLTRLQHSRLVTSDTPIVLGLIYK